MGLGVGSFETLGRDVGVELGRLQGGMAQNLLNRAKVRATFKKVSGRTMPKPMRTQITHAFAPSPLNVQ